MKPPRLPASVLWVLAMGALQAQWVAETPGELAVAADWTGDGRADLLVVDRATGVLRAGVQSASGSFDWREPRAAGPPEITALAFGTFLGSAAPTLAVTSPALNRLNLLRDGQAASEPWFVTHLGPRALAATLGGPNGAGGDLFVATSDNGAPTPHRLENWKAPQQGATTSAALARGNAVGTAGDIAFIARAADAGGTADALVFHAAGNLAAPTVAGGLPLNADWAWGEFGAPTQSFLFWQRGAPLLTLRPLPRSAAPLAFGPAVSFSLGAPVFSVTVLAGTGTPRILIVFGDGADAGVFTFDGVNAPLLAQSLAPAAGERFRTALPLSGGDFALFSGSPTGTASETVRRHRRQPGGSYVAEAPTPLPALPVSGPPRSNVLLFSGEPFVDPSAQLFQVVSARDWSFAASGLPGSLNVQAEIFQGSQSGLGGRQSLSLGSVGAAPPGAHALANQYAADLSISTPAPATGPQTLSISLTPPPGAYADPLAVTPASSPAGAQIFYRRGASGAWVLLDSALTTSVSVEASGLLEVHARNGSARSPIVGGHYTIGPVAPDPLGGPDLDANGLGDAWEQYFGKPSPAADKDGDGFTTAEEYAAGTDPCDPGSKPGGPTDPGQPRLILTAVEPPPIALLHFRLLGKPGVRHAVQSSTTLATGQWSDFVSEFTMPAGGFHDFTAPWVVGQRRFFRGLAR